MENETECVFGTAILCWGKFVRLQKLPACGRLIWVYLLMLSSFYAPIARGQDPTPETAPTLFPGGALVSFDSNFTTRGVISDSSQVIPLTARPTFSHAGSFIFRWRFYRNFDLTVLLPVITNHYEMPPSN